MASHWGAAEATIVAEELIQEKTGQSVTLLYEFLDLAGALHIGERKNVPLSTVTGEAWGQRQRLTARPIAPYHPKYPKLNALYPLGWVKLRYEMPVLSSETT